jgi:hypothetical protein
MVNDISADQNVGNRLNLDVLGTIFSHLDSVALGRVFKVCKGWQELSGVERLWEGIFYREFVFFGPREWKENFGDPGAVPVINYQQTVKEIFAFTSKWPKEWDRKMVWLQPKDILQPNATERVPLTPIKIGALVASKLGGECNPTGYRFFWPAALQEHGGKLLQESFWGCMTPDVLPKSRGESYDVLCRFAREFGGETPEFSPAVTCIFLKSMEGKRVFSNDPLTYTCCQESTNDIHLAVGGFAPAGLGVNFPFDYVGSGVAALRKFKAIGT